MKLPSSYIKEPARSAVRFTVVGLTGTGIQYGWYYLFLELFRRIWPEAEWVVGTTFTIGFLLEMISNYFFTSYYTFSSRPSLKNLGGFLVGRGVNYVVQMVFLWILIYVGVAEAPAGIITIVLAGIVNYFVTRLFFKEKKK